MFKSEQELLEWHKKGVVSTFYAFVYLTFKYHSSLKNSCIRLRLIRFKFKKVAYEKQDFYGTKKPVAQQIDQRATGA